MKNGTFVILPFGNDHVWTVKHNYGEKLWSLPGGGVEPHQDHEATGVAECLEETSFNVILLYKVGIFTGKKSNQVVELWLGKPKNGFDSFTGVYDKREILMQGICPVDPPMDFPIYSAQRMMIKAWDLLNKGKINGVIEDYLSAPFKTIQIQEWYDEYQQKLSSESQQ